MGLFDSIGDAAKGVGHIVASAASDLVHDVPGAAGLGLVLVSGGAALAFAPALGQVVLAGAVLGDATHLTHNATGSLADAVVQAAEHPAELGRAAVDLELAAAAHYVPGADKVLHNVRAAFDATAPVHHVPAGGKTPAALPAPIHHTAGTTAAPPPPQRGWFARALAWLEAHAHA